MNPTRWGLLLLRAAPPSNSISIAERLASKPTDVTLDDSTDCSRSDLHPKKVAISGAGR